MLGNGRYQEPDTGGQSCTKKQLAVGFYPKSHLPGRKGQQWPAGPVQPSHNNQLLAVHASPELHILKTPGLEDEICPSLEVSLLKENGRDFISKQWIPLEGCG